MPGFREWLENIPRVVWTELLIRFTLILTFLIIEFAELQPFKRHIQKEEAWLYRFPTHPVAYISSRALTCIMIISCVAVILVSYGVHRVAKPGLVALLVLSLAIPLTGIITIVLKLQVGRLRPDYLSRCYGEHYRSITDVKKPCTGDIKLIQDGRKSFPSGHSSLGFCSLGFVSLFLASQLQVFSPSKHAKASWRLLLVILPLIAATLVSISRTCDYHHHWQDVVAGGFIGFFTMYVIYHLYFPPLTSPDCSKPFPLVESEDKSEGLEKVNMTV